MTKQLLGGIVALAAIGLCVAGCADTPNTSPMSTSLMEMTGESRCVVTVHPDQGFSVSRQKQLISTTGNLMVVNPGVHAFHEGGPVAGAIIITPESYSFVVQQTCVDPSVTDAVVWQAKTAIERVQQSVAKLVQLTVQIGVDRMAKKDVTTLEQKRDTEEANLEKYLEDYRAAANKGGVLVARWVASQQGGGSVTAGSFAQAKIDQSRQVSGYVVLGNWRSRVLYFGKDFGVFLRAVPANEWRGFKSALMVSTYVLQAQHVAYTTSLDTQMAAASSFEFDPRQISKSLSAIDEVKITAYIAQAASLSNSGCVTASTWEKIPYPFVDLQPVGSPDTNNMQLYRIGIVKCPDITTDQKGWQTVCAVFGQYPALYKQLRTAADKPTGWGVPAVDVKDHGVYVTLRCADWTPEQPTASQQSATQDEHLAAVSRQQR